MNDTRIQTMTNGAARTWWWHPRPVASAELNSSAGTWWWHPRPVA
ncbi:hypothetical protein BJY21_003739 [Kineosphaera limosa]|nr:hypothetical protein [Kineosphaera limosa]NYE02555.1 hypothetical protein [Kineosphaera limosa]